MVPVVELLPATLRGGGLGCVASFYFSATQSKLLLPFGDKNK